jgi:high affinity sulfate transporter 1
VVSPSLLQLRGVSIPRELGVAITVGALTLPSALGYAEVAGLPPVTGLYTALAAMLVFGLLGSNRHLVLGPDAAFAALIGTVLGEAAGFDPRRALLLAAPLAVLVGVGFVALGLARAGFLATFLSRPLLSGFMTGLAVTILVGQLQKILGIPAPSTSVLGKLSDIAGNLDQVDPWSVTLGVATIVASMVLGRLFPRVPVAAGLLTIGLVAVVVLNLDERGVDVLGTVPEGLPELDAPSLRWDDVNALITGALALVLIGFADAVLQGRQYAKSAGYRAEPDRDLVAVGVANLACSVVGGYPTGASASRSAAALNGGGRTTLVSIGAAGVIGLVLVLLAPYLSDLPVPVLAGIVTAAAIRLLAVQDIRSLWPDHREELLVALVAAAGVILAGVLAGVGLALVLSLLGFVRRSARVDVAVLGRRAGRDGWFDARRSPVETVPGVLVVRIGGPVFFGNAEAICARVLEVVDDAPDSRLLVVHVPGVTDLDVTGLEAFGDLLDALAARKVEVVVSGAPGSLRDRLAAAGRGTPVVKTVDEAVALAPDATSPLPGSAPPVGRHRRTRLRRTPERPTP